MPRSVGSYRDDAEQTGRFLGAEMLSLSKQNWNDTQFDGGEPITTRAAHQVGDILRHVGDAEVLPPRYANYM